MTSSAPARIASGHQLEDWLLCEAETLYATTGLLIGAARFFRVSSAQLSIFQANLTAGLRAADRSDPDVAKAMDVGGLLVERTVEGRECRDANRTLEIRRGMLEGGGRSERLVGYATLFGSTLFVYLLASAAKGDLFDARHPEDSGNAATEVARTVMRALSTHARVIDANYRLRCHFTDETRATRSRAQAAKLVATAKQHRVLLVLRGTEWDVRKVTDGQIIDQLLGMAATERDFSVQRLVRGKASLLISHRLPEPFNLNVPFTHEPYRAARTDEQGRALTLVDDHWPAPRPGSGATLTGLVRDVIAAADRCDEIGENVPWDSLGRELSVKHGLRSRAPEHHALVDLHELDGPGSALKRLLDERYRAAWRTGRLPWVTELVVEVDGLTDQLPTADVLPNGNRSVRAWVDCPIPADLDVTEDEWERLDAILAQGGRAGKPASGWARPLRGDAWIDGDEQFTVDLRGGSRYRTLSRPAVLTSGRGSSRRGWPGSAQLRKARGVKIIVAVNAGRLNETIGAALEKLAVDLEGKLAVLDVPHWRAATTAVTNGNDIRRVERERLTDRIIELAALAKGAREERYRAAAAGDDVVRQQAEDDEHRYRTDLEAVESDKARLEQQDECAVEPADPAETEAVVAISTLEELSAALQTRWRADGTAPPAVQEATRAVLGRSLRLGLGPTVEKASWSVQVRLPLKDGGSAVYPLSGTVKASSHAASARRNPAAVAERYLWMGEDYESIGLDFGIDGSGQKNSYLLVKLKTWLGQRGTPGGLFVSSVDLRRVVLDAPLVLRRAVYALMMGREGELRSEGIDGAYLDLIRDRYLAEDATGWSESWTSGPFLLQRGVLALIVDLPDPVEGVRVVDAMRERGASYDALTGLAGTRLGVPPAVTRNWERTGAPPLEERRLFPIRCAWDDCPGNRRRRSGVRPPLATHFLHVPEVSGALLCPTCRRVPDPSQPHASAVFPADYFAPHRRRTLEDDGTRIGTRLESGPWVAKLLVPVA